MVAALLAAAVVATAGVVGWSSRQTLLAETEAQAVVIANLAARSAAARVRLMNEIETAIGEHMVVQATMAAHLAALGEATGVGSNEINERLKQIADETVLDEIWITDEKGHAHLRNMSEIDFTFSPDPDKQPQAHAFWPLLTGESRSVVQEARQREVDTQIFKYVGVAGVDKPRIVQVGYHADYLQALRQRMGVARLVSQLVSEENVIAIRVVDRDMTTLAYAERGQGDEVLPTGSELEKLSLATKGRPQSFLDGSLLKVAAPIGADGGELEGGAILVALPTDHVQAAIREEARWALAVSALVILLGSVIAIFGARTISKPIARLTRMTERIAHGDFTQRIDIPARNEIGVLADSFNEMTRRLNESIEHLKETTAAKERVESELKIAHEIQMSMVPKIFPPFPDRSEFDIFATLVPAKEVGGDLYDFFIMDDERLCFAIGDVSGKGVPASLFMAVTKTLFRATAGNGGTPGEILARLNAEISRDNEPCMFVTLFCGILNFRTGEVEYSNGGHNLPYHVHRGGVSRVQNVGGRALGLIEESPYASGRIVLAPGEALLLYTDGVTEAMNPGDALYSDERLEQFLASRHGASPRQMIGDLIDNVRAFAGGAPQSDDITSLALLYVGAKPPREEMEIKFSNRLSELAKMNGALTEFAQRHGLTPRVVHDLNLVLEEIVTNVISYAYTDEREHEIKVRLSFQGGEVSAEVEDDGRPFDPLTAPEPDLEASLEERAVGGLGIHFMRQMMDGLEYQRQDGKNLLRLKKRLS
jgi:sigma-B regulation protein RsbU (phosphoserine phosphatase)